MALSVWLLSPGSSAVPQNPNPPEVQAHEGPNNDTNPSFQLHVERNLVTVRVVVRDNKDRPVGNLRQEDFRLFDEGKPQDILGFTVETSHPNPAPEAAPPRATGGGKTEIPRPPIRAVAQRYVILYFTDLHMGVEEIDRTRLAAWRYVTTLVRPQDRVATFTASGKDDLDFTDDREKIHDALFRLAPRPHPPGTGCPPEIGDYEAYLVTKQAPDALAIVHVEAVQCDCGSSGGGDILMERSALLMDMSSRKGGTESADPCPPMAMRRVEQEAAQVWELANIQAQYSLQGIEFAVRRLTAMPGQRTLVLVSPGFLSETQTDKIDAITNRALQQDVVISAIGATGLAPRKMQAGVATRPDLEARHFMIQNAGTVASEDVLASLSAGTGGVFFHNDNDLNDGFRQAAAVPEVYYVLTFSPANIKLDGKFHPLKVTLNTRDRLTVQARRGYFASETGLAGQASSQDELAKVVFSQEEIRGLPAEVSTHVEKANDRESTLTVVIHVDVRQLRFRKEVDRSADKLIFHTTLFDRDGNYVTAKEASLDLHLKDTTLERLLKSGLNATTSFQMAPGTYRVREVVRDTASNGMSALDCIVEVPGPPLPEAAGKPSPQTP